LSRKLLEAHLASKPLPWWETGEPPPPKRTRKRKLPVASVIRQMKRAGVEIAGCEIDRRDGTVRVIAGKPVTMNADDERNEWDTVQ
jgi:hypothetical protein